MATVAALAVAAGCGNADDDTAPPEGAPTVGTTGQDPTPPESDQQDTASPGDGETEETEAPQDGEDAGADEGTDTDGEGEQPEEDLEGFVDPGTREESEPGGYDLVVTGVRTGVHAHFERVVLDIEGGSEVGWWAEYADNPALDGSGAPVSLAGDGTLAVVVRGVEMPTGEDHPYDPGQLLVEPEDTAMVTEVLRTAPFEGQLQVFIGTREEVPFRVMRLDDPERLVIDVMTH